MGSVEVMFSWKGPFKAGVSVCLGRGASKGLA